MRKTLASFLFITLFFAPLFAEVTKKRVEVASYCTRLPPEFVKDFRYKEIKEKFDITITPGVYNFARNFQGDHDNLHKIIFIDYCNDPTMKKIPKHKAVCFKWEAVKIRPELYDYYDRVYTFDDDLIDNKKFFKFYYPVHRPILKELLPFSKKKFCVIIATRWRPDRVAMLDFFATKPKDTLHIYGSVRKVPKYLGHEMFKGDIPGWPSSDLKVKKLNEYKFCICFENTHHVPGYITEKIFDVFAGGCVPIYWGPDNVEKYIPKECFIDYRKFKNNEELYQYLMSMKESEYQKYVENIKVFLQSDAAKLFSVDNFEKTFTEAVMS